MGQLKGNVTAQKVPQESSTLSFNVSKLIDYQPSSTAFGFNAFAWKIYS